MRRAVAIYPFAALHARRRHRGSGAELVFAALESHRYVYEWDLGPTSDHATLDSAMAILQADPT